MSGEIATSKRIIVHYKDVICFIYRALRLANFFGVWKFCFYLFCITLFKTLIFLHSYCSMNMIFIISTSHYKQYFYLHINKLTCWSFKMTAAPACHITVSQSCSLSGQTDGACPVIVIYGPGESKEGHINIIGRGTSCVVRMYVQLGNTYCLTINIKLVLVNIARSNSKPGKSKTRI